MTTSAPRPNAPSFPGLVSVGMPVRNGGATLARALESILTQTHTDIEVVVSDNCSTDDTADVISAFAHDPRVRTFRQERTLTGVQHFRFVLEQARGEFFMWAAHDDWRSPNFIEVLLAALQRHPEAVLAFSEARSCPMANLEFAFPVEPFLCDVDTSGLSLLARLRKLAQRGCTHIYGLIRRDSLLRYPWYSPRLSPDRPLLNWLAAQGPFITEGAARFLYFNPGKSAEQSAVENFGEGLGRLAREECVWRSACAVSRATWARRRTWVPALLVFVLLYVWEARGLRNAIYPWMPNWARRLWRALKYSRYPGRTNRGGARTPGR